jgi:cyclopropane-fatty-acyl-phospholipid synthase
MAKWYMLTTISLETLYDLLPVGGRFYIQTIVFSKNMIPLEEIAINSEKGYIPHVLALMMEQFRDS